MDILYWMDIVRQKWGFDNILIAFTRKTKADPGWDSQIYPLL